jgi:glycosyltransferase involved in cell wall biosynthesis
MSISKPLVTIGIPCYNVEKFIALSIRSVLAQTYSNFELLITDDGSKDHTLEEIRKFDDPRIIVIADGENHGISYRLNQQIRLAKGEYFIRMDGDDIMFTDRIEKEVNFLIEHQDVDVVGSGAVIIDDENQIIGIRQEQMNLCKPEDALNGSTFIHPTVAGKLQFFRKYLYDEQLSGVEDKDLWCRGLQDSVYAIIQEPLLFYRDPLKFKLSVYLSRKQKGRRQVFMRWRLFMQKMPAIRYIFDSYLKSICAYLLCKLGKESRFIAKRNMDGFNMTPYYDILNKIIK